MKKNRPIRKLLAANRSEIAIRVFRAANELGLGTVAIFTYEDRLSLHRFKADEAYLVGAGKGPVKAYLDIRAHRHRESARRRCHPSGLRIPSGKCRPRTALREERNHLVGPTPLELIGDKTARRAAAAAGVPTLPGTETPATSRAEAQDRRGDRISLIVKAAIGGGGRGMRVVHDRTNCGRLDEAQREAKAAFGDAAVFLERFASRPAHRSPDPGR